MSETNKNLVRRWFEEVWNQGRPEAIRELMSEDCVNHGLSGDPVQPLRGASGFLPFHTQFREAFPNIEVVVEDDEPARAQPAAGADRRGAGHGAEQRDRTLVVHSTSPSDG